jgi:hypothetical protein
MEHHLRVGLRHGGLHHGHVADVALDMGNQTLDPGLTEQADLLGGQRQAVTTAPSAAARAPASCP